MGLAPGRAPRGQTAWAWHRAWAFDRVRHRRTARNQGTTFVIYLPAKPAPEGGADRPEAQSAIPTGTETILVAEDEDSVRSMVRKILSAAGYTVLEARHGADAVLVSGICPHGIDLLQTDVVMPEMNGLRLAEVIGTERPDIRIVFMSGYTRGEVDRKGLTEPGVSQLGARRSANGEVELAKKTLAVPAAGRSGWSTGSRRFGSNGSGTWCGWCTRPVLA